MKNKMHFLSAITAVLFKTTSSMLLYYQCHPLLTAFTAILPKTTSSLLDYEQYFALPVSLFGCSV
jgi:hypothetical protein